MSNVTVADLSKARSGYRVSVETSTVVLVHASVPVYVPSPEGGEYCFTAVCNHDHGDDRDALQECGRRLARIIDSGRCPKWAKVAG